MAHFAYDMNFQIKNAYNRKNNTDPRNYTHQIDSYLNDERYYDGFTDIGTFYGGILLARFE